MRRTRFDEGHCPLARTADLLGDWWSPLILRDLFLGARRFAELETSLAISKGVLAQRLRRFEEEGIVARHRYEQHPPRDEYHLTDKGQALSDVLVAMWRFGDDWLFDESPGAAVELLDERTGEPLRPRMVDERTGEPLELTSTKIRLRR